MPDVFEMLAAEHRLIRRLLDELPDRRRRSQPNMVVDRLNTVLCAHLAFDENVLHPLLTPPFDHLAATAAGEHRRLLDGLAELNQAIAASSVEGVEAALVTLPAAIGSHIDNDECVGSRTCGPSVTRPPSTPSAHGCSRCDSRSTPSRRRPTSSR